MPSRTSSTVSDLIVHRHLDDVSTSHSYLCAECYPRLYDPRLLLGENRVVMQRREDRDSRRTLEYSRRLYANTAFLEVDRAYENLQKSGKGYGMGGRRKFSPMHHGHGSGSARSTPDFSKCTYCDPAHHPTTTFSSDMAAF
jgi:hypothetical protein